VRRRPARLPGCKAACLLCRQSDFSSVALRAANLLRMRVPHQPLLSLAVIGASRALLRQVRFGYIIIIVTQDYTAD
jgi:hypothetical protein